MSRERVHQIIQSALKKKPFLREDEYGYWFRKYDLSEDFCTFVFDMHPFAYAYLNMMREKGLASVKDMLQYPNMNGIHYSRINQYLHKNLVFIEDEYVEKDRKQIVLKLVKTHYFQQVGSFSDFYREYMDFLKSRGLSEIEELKFVSEMAFESSVHQYPDILYKYGKRFRYYPVDEYDINDFIDRLNLTKYQNKEISTKKIMLDYPELMEEFDIRDEYELHNLLKKTEKKWNTDAKQQISLQRMPLISFGLVNREKQIKDLLYQISPVTKEAFGRYYEKTYSVLSKTFFANMSQCINKYNHNDIYDVELPLFDKSEEEYMVQSLTDDFYFIEDVKNIYTEKFGLESVKKVNVRIMDELGYKLYSQYAIKKNYPSADNYFQHFILKNHFFDLNQLDSRFIYIPNFYTVFDHLKTEFKILEYGDKQFIRYDLFRKVLPDVGAQDFLDFIDKAIKASGTQPFFIFRSLKNEGFEDPFEILGTGEWFSTALIRNSKKIRFKKIGGTTLFYKGSAKQTTVDFIRYIMKDIISIGTTELIEYLKEKFGIKLDKEKMKQFIKKSDMYYDQYTMKLYITEDASYEEIYG